jgi:hypothetical protein
MENERPPAQYTTIWVGAFFFYLANGFKGNFSEYTIDKYQNRNFSTGLIIQIVIVIGLLLFLVFRAGTFTK